MENRQEFLSRIVYKKSAYEQMKQDLKKYYNKKRILLLTTKSLVNMHLTEIVNAICFAESEFKHYVAKNNFNLQELNEINEIMTEKNYELVICFGGGKCCDVSKYFSAMYGIPLFVCPSAPTNNSYFNNVYINPYDNSECCSCDIAERIYIQEDVIKTCPYKISKQGLYFIMSTYELILSEIINAKLFNNDKKTSNILKITEKIENEFIDILTGNDESKLILMDNLIELSFEMMAIDINSTLNMFCILRKCCEKDIVNLGAGEQYFICARVLILAYCKLFGLKNIVRYEYPNFVNIVKIIKKYGIFIKKINNFEFFNKIYQNFINNNSNIDYKNMIINECDFVNKKINKFFELIKKYNNPTIYGLKFYKILDSLKVLPFICQNNIIVSTMGAIGFLN